MSGKNDIWSYIIVEKKETLDEMEIKLTKREQKMQNNILVIPVSREEKNAPTRM